MLKNNSFSITQQKKYLIYLDIATFQDFKVFLLSATRLRDFARVYRDRRIKQKEIIACLNLA